MEMPRNSLKHALHEGTQQIGIWCSLGSYVATEIVAASGFDWLLIDTEHAPNELPLIHQQLQALAPYPVASLVRPAWNDTVVIKRLLDIGVQSLLVPFVQNAEEARRAVAATRYPPDGVRGVSMGMRANRYSRVKDYHRHAAEEICVLVQLETRAALADLDAILKVDGVDGIFIGPADLSADMGHLGNSAHPDVQTAIADAVPRIRRAGKAPGIMSFNDEECRRYLDLGCLFVAVGSDQNLLARNSDALAAKYKTAAAGSAVQA